MSKWRSSSDPLKDAQVSRDFSKKKIFKKIIKIMIFKNYEIS